MAENIQQIIVWEINWSIDLKTVHKSEFVLDSTNDADTNVIGTFCPDGTIIITQLTGIWQVSFYRFYVHIISIDKVGIAFGCVLVLLLQITPSQNKMVKILNYSESNRANYISIINYKNGIVLSDRNLKLSVSIKTGIFYLNCIIVFVFFFIEVC